jgi:hypothetical protein
MPPTQLPVRGPHMLRNHNRQKTEGKTRIKKRRKIKSDANEQTGRRRGGDDGDHEHVRYKHLGQSYSSSQLVIGHCSIQLSV